MNASCEHFAEYVAKSLDANAARTFEAHLASCPSCAAELKRERELERLLTLARQRPVPVPSVLQEWLESRLEQEAARRGWRARIGRYAPLAAAATLLLAMTALWSMRNLPRSQSPGSNEAPMSSATPQPPLGPERALTELALFAVERRVAGQRGPTWLSGPSFAGAGSTVGSRSAQPRGKREVKPEQAEEADEGPKRGTLVRFNAFSVESIRTLGERKLDQTVVQPVRNKENIPC